MILINISAQYVLFHKDGYKLDKSKFKSDIIQLNFKEFSNCFKVLHLKYAAPSVLRVIYK